MSAILKDQGLTAKEVAEYLGLAPRTVYTLPIACYRFGSSVRYDLKDVEAYKQSCRSQGKREDSGFNLTASSPDGESALASYFQKAGRKSKRTNTTKGKSPASTHLQLVSNKSH
jgi:excisionase family DNA binding protein